MYTILNITGLSIGLASFLLIMMYINDELSYDNYHKNADSIYRVVNVINNKGVGEKSSGSPFPLGPTLKQEFSKIVKQESRIFNFQKKRHLIISSNNSNEEEKVFFVEENLFEIFDYHFTTRKDPIKVFPDQFSVALSVPKALEYFGDTSVAIGSILRYQDKFNFIVTALFEATPSQTHFKADFLFSFSAIDSIMKGNPLITGWIWNPCWTYILIENNDDKNELCKQLPTFADNHFKEITEGKVSLILQPLKAIHLYSQLDYEIETNNTYSNVIVLFVIALFILTIALVNYINLTTAYGINRANEIALKKVNGAIRKQIAWQFMTESVLISLVSLIFALAIAEMLIPYYSSITGKNFIGGLLMRPDLFLLVILAGLTTGIVAGIYPAVQLSKLPTVEILKNKKTGIRKKSILTRKILVVVQFSVSVTILIITIGMYHQIKVLKNKDLGFNYQNVLVIYAENIPIYKEFHSLRKELLSQTTGIKQVAGSNYILGVDHNLYGFYTHPGDTVNPRFFPGMLGTEFFTEIYNIPMLKLWNDSTHQSDHSAVEAFVNESFAKLYGWPKVDTVMGSYLGVTRLPGHVHGITPDYYVTSLHEPQVPFVLSIFKDTSLQAAISRYILIRTDGQNNSRTLAEIKKVWNKHFEGKRLQYGWQSNIMNDLYKNESMLAMLAGIFMILSFIMSAMGMLGLTSYLTSQKSREAGLRKALGASLNQIAWVFIKEFAILIAISVSMAWVASWFILQYLGRNYSIPITQGFLFFILSGLAGFLFALLIIAYHSIRFARTKPSDSLRRE